MLTPADFAAAPHASDRGPHPQQRNHHSGHRPLRLGWLGRTRALRCRHGHQRRWALVRARKGPLKPSEPYAVTLRRLLRSPRYFDGTVRQVARYGPRLDRASITTVLSCGHRGTVRHTYPTRTRDGRRALAQVCDECVAEKFGPEFAP